MLLADCTARIDVIVVADAADACNEFDTLTAFLQDLVRMFKVDIVKIIMFINMDITFYLNMKL